MPKTVRNSAARDAYLNLIRVHELLMGEFEELFRTAGLTHTQFNVLRILLTGPKGGVPCQAVGEGLLKRVPDVTRLLDRMERDGLVARRRSDEDRRVVLVEITAAGRDRAEGLYGAVDKLHRRQFAHLGAGETAALNDLLEATLDRG